MKILTGLLLTAALAFGANKGAEAYHFTPSNGSVRLHGKLTFTPNGGQGQPFTCGVVFDLKAKVSEISKVKFPNGDCSGVILQSLPWFVSIKGPDSGQFSFSGFTSFSGDCGATAIQFGDNDSGIWNIPEGQCISGALTSRPPIIIVQ